MDVVEQNELRGLTSDRKKYNAELANARNEFAMLLRGAMGEDMKKVLSGERKIRIPWRKRMSFKIKCFFKRLFGNVGD